MKSAANKRPGFTLIELLIVIGIIVLLVGLSLVVGNQVVGGGRTRLTTDTLRVLDNATQAYMSATGKPFPTKLQYTAPDGGMYEYALIDARETAMGTNDEICGTRPTDSGARALAVLLSRPESEAIIKSLPSKVTRTTIVDPAIACPSPTPPDSGQGFRPAQPAATIEVLDGWGRPIRFVHPAFDGGWGPFWNGTALVSTGRDQTKTIAEQRGAQVKNTDYRRSIMPVDPTQPLNLGATGDADESLAAGNRPFWYSGGADGLAATKADNVYSSQPSYAEETAGL